MICLNETKQENPQSQEVHFLEKYLLGNKKKYIKKGTKTHFGCLNLFDKSFNIRKYINY